MTPTAATTTMLMTRTMIILIASTYHTTVAVKFKQHLRCPVTKTKKDGTYSCDADEAATTGVAAAASAQAAHGDKSSNQCPTPVHSPQSCRH